MEELRRLLRVRVHMIVAGAPAASTSSAYAGSLKTREVDMPPKELNTTAGPSAVLTQVTDAYAAYFSAGEPPETGVRPKGGVCRGQDYSRNLSFDGEENDR